MAGREDPARRGGFGVTSRYGLEIRAAAGADAPGLSELFAACGLSLSAGALSERLDALRADGGVALIAGSWGPPSGVVVMHWYRGLAASGRIARITTLLVAPEDRRRGIGRLLIKTASQAARLAGCDGVEIVVESLTDDLAEFCLATGLVGGGTLFARGLRKKG